MNFQNLFSTLEGKPRVAILPPVRLSPQERMFFVSLLLNQVLARIRTQPGTTSLQAVLYIDELYSFRPPVVNPPSKEPLLTHLKQARAFGLGLMLATQNPVDLDFKGLSNAGTPGLSDACRLNRIYVACWMGLTIFEAVAAGRQLPEPLAAWLNGSSTCTMGTKKNRLSFTPEGPGTPCAVR